MPMLYPSFADTAASDIALDNKQNWNIFRLNCIAALYKSLSISVGFEKGVIFLKRNLRSYFSANGTVNGLP